MRPAVAALLVAGTMSCTPAPAHWEGKAMWDELDEVWANARELCLPVVANPHMLRECQEDFLLHHLRQRRREEMGEPETGTPKAEERDT